MRTQWGWGLGYGTDEGKNWQEVSEQSLKDEQEFARPSWKRGHSNRGSHSSNRRGLEGLEESTEGSREASRREGLFPEGSLMFSYVLGCIGS